MIMISPIPFKYDAATCKELKEAGFPQKQVDGKGSYFFFDDAGNFYFSNPEDMETVNEYYVCPGADELARQVELMQTRAHITVDVVPATTDNNAHFDSEWGVAIEETGDMARGPGPVPAMEFLQVSSLWHVLARIYIDTKKMRNRRPDDHSPISDE